MKTLVADDDVTSRKVLQTVLSRLGECDVAENGKEAVDVFKFALDANMPYDLICLDIMMPEMDGQTALQEIRSYERAKTGTYKTKIIMTTALGDHSNIMQADKSDCDAYLVKPIDPRKLEEFIKNSGLST